MLVSLLSSFHKLLEGENRSFDDDAFTCMYVQKDYLTTHAPLCIVKYCLTINLMAYVARQCECFSAIGINGQFQLSIKLCMWKAS